MLIRDPDGLVVFSADEMVQHCGGFRNYWGSYWTCQKCQLCWGSHVVRCARCLADKTEDTAQSPVGADGWLDQQKLTEIVEAEGTYTTQGIGAVYTAIKPTADEQEKIVNEVTEQIASATKGSIPKPTAEEILESIRKIFNGCAWLYEYDSEWVATGNVQITLDCEEWDNLKSLLREDGPGKVWRV